MDNHEKTALEIKFLILKSGEGTEAKGSKVVLIVLVFISSQLVAVSPCPFHAVLLAAVTPQA